MIVDNYEYITRNYNPLNRAINNEVEKQLALNKLSNAKARLQMVIAICVAAVSVALLILLGIAIYKIWQYQVGGWQSIESTHTVVQTESLQVTPEQNAQIKEDLQQIEREQEQDPLITTQFTVFQAAMTDTGEEVVTGLTYDPTDLDNPVEQYCYLEGSELGGEPLAAVDAEYNVTQQTENPFYLGLIGKYCLFKLPPTGNGV